MEQFAFAPRHLNKAIQRTPYYVRTMNDVIPKVSGASHFSILDARRRFWKVKRDDDRSRRCTSSTPCGKYRWKRLPFGLTYSGDVFQDRIENVFGKLDCLSGIADDTFIYGKVNKGMINTYTTPLTQHWKIMYGSTQTSKVDQTSFWWFTWSLDGLRADDLKIKSITNMPSPQTLAESQTFMGMVNYLNQFSPIVAETSQPLRRLMKKDTLFVWQPEHLRAFQNVQRIITDAPVLAYYDPEKDNVIQSDASLEGIGFVLTQS